MQAVESQAKYAKELHERVRREFPEVTIPHHQQLLRFTPDITSFESTPCGINRLVTQFAFLEIVLPLIISFIKRAPPHRDVRGQHIYTPPDRRILLVARGQPWSMLVCSLQSSHSYLTLPVPSLRVLVHPNTGDPYRDHTELVSWIGPPWPLSTDILKH